MVSYFMGPELRSPITAD